MESNHWHRDFQSLALPTELSRHNIMATQKGLEPSTSSVTGWRSNQLSYWAALLFNFIEMVGLQGFEPRTNRLWADRSASWAKGPYLFGDPDGIRTHVAAVKGRCLNHLTTGPRFGSSGRTRTYSLPVNSRLLHHWATEEYFNSGSDLLSRESSTIGAGGLN